MARRGATIMLCAFTAHLFISHDSLSGSALFVANALKQPRAGLEESDDGIWSLYLGPVLLGKIDEAMMKVYG